MTVTGQSDKFYDRNIHTDHLDKGRLSYSSVGQGRLPGGQWYVWAVFRRTVGKKQPGYVGEWRTLKAEWPLHRVVGGFNSEKRLRRVNGRKWDWPRKHFPKCKLFALCWGVLPSRGSQFRVEIRHILNRISWEKIWFLQILKFNIKLF